MTAVARVGFGILDKMADFSDGCSDNSDVKMGSRESDGRLARYAVQSVAYLGNMCLGT